MEWDQTCLKVYLKGVDSYSWIKFEIRLYEIQRNDYKAQIPIIPTKKGDPTWRTSKINDERHSQWIASIDLLNGLTLGVYWSTVRSIILFSPFPSFFYI